MIRMAPTSSTTGVKKSVVRTSPWSASMTVPELRHRLRRGYLGFESLSYPIRFRNNLFLIVASLVLVLIGIAILPGGLSR